jgi:hypothetical protein
MTRETEFALTLNLPCSAGTLVSDLECRVTVSYEVDAGSLSWSLEDVRLDGESGVIRSGDRLFWLFEEGIKFTPRAEEIIFRECWQHYDDSRDGDPDYALERKRDYAMEDAA